MPTENMTANVLADNEAPEISKLKEELFSVIIGMTDEEKIILLSAAKEAFL